MFLVERIDETVEIVPGHCAVGSRNVAVIPIKFSACVDQKTVYAFWRRSIVVLVVKGARMFVQRDDVRVGKLAFGLLAGVKVGHVNVELAGSRQECAMRRQMSAHADFGGSLQVDNFKLCFKRATVIELIDEWPDIVRRYHEIVGEFRVRSNVGDVGQCTRCRNDTLDLIF